MNHYPRMRVTSVFSVPDGGHDLATVEIIPRPYFQFFEQISTKEMTTRWKTEILLDSMQNCKLPSSSACACCGKLLTINYPLCCAKPAEYFPWMFFPSRFYFVYQTTFVDKEGHEWDSLMTATVCSEECRKNAMSTNNLSEKEVYSYDCDVSYEWNTNDRD